jgi:hypothetical protein
MDLLAVLDSKIATVRKELENLLAARQLLAKTEGRDAPFPIVGSVKGKMSKEGREAISRAQTKRWAKVRAAKKKGK